jgi:glycosyltransferase involved in cell wall biosynthesis
MTSVSVAFCTYNRSEWLPGLVKALRSLECPVPFEIVAVDNNSSDETAKVLAGLARAKGAPLRWVSEPQQGIVFARNRAIKECLNSDVIAFIDDDELPQHGWLKAAWDALERECAQCVGGRIRITFELGKRPRWLGDALLHFLGHLDYGDEAFWIDSLSTPVWSGNVAYRTSLFKRSQLRFDARYNRAGKGIGGGEDAEMFRRLLEQGAMIRYRPDMLVSHLVEQRKLRRGFFLRLDGLMGYKEGRYEGGEYEHTLMGVPPLMVTHALRHTRFACVMALRNKDGALRQAMIASHAWGQVWGRIVRSKLRPPSSPSGSADSFP